MQSPLNSRQSTRVEVSLKSWVRVQDGVFRSVQCLDLSREGASLLLDFTPAPGEDFVFCLKFDQEAPVALRARVVWAARGHVGIEFADKDQSAYRRLLRFHWVEVSKAALQNYSVSA